MIEDRVKSYSELDAGGIEDLQIGDPIACELCGGEGVWNLDSEFDLVNAITESKYTLKEDAESSIYVCEECEVNRCVAWGLEGMINSEW